MGSAIAFREETQPVDNTPEDEKELVAELRELTNRLKVVARLRAWAEMLKSLPRRSIHNFKWLLLDLDVENNTLEVTGYADRTKAQDALQRAQRPTAGDKDAVLVWVRSIDELRTAYPNYYADTTEFLEALTTTLKRRRLGRPTNMRQSVARVG